MVDVKTQFSGGTIINTLNTLSLWWYFLARYLSISHKYAATLCVFFLLGTAPNVFASAADDAKTGLVAGKAGNYQEAIKKFAKAISSGELSQEALADVFNNRGVAYRRSGNFHHAIEDFTSAIALNPTQPTFWANRGLAYAKKGVYDLGIADFNQAIHLEPNDPMVYLKRGNAYFDKGLFKESIVDYSQSLKLKPDLILALHNRCEAYERKDQKVLARRDCRRVLELDPNNEAVKHVLFRLE